VLRLVVSDGDLSGSDDVVVLVAPSPNRPPTVSAGADQAVTLPAGAVLMGTVADDGLPVGAGVTLSWTQVAGPGPALIANPAATSTSVTFPTDGFYAFRLTASDTILSVSDDVVVRAPPPNAAPSVDAGPDTAVALPANLTLNYTVNDDGRPAGGALTVEWTQVSGPGSARFSNQTLAAVTVGFNTPGTYVLRVTATDTQFTATDDVTIVVSGIAPSAPTVLLTSPAEGAEVTGPIAVVGTVASDALVSWKLELRMADDPAFRTFASGTTPVTNGPLGTFDPTILLNGIAYIRLTAADTTGATVSTAPVGVLLTKNQKVGHFTVSFNDLTVPVAGFPIQVNRTYDSRDKRPGDFGVGWRLELKSVKLQENRTPGADWIATETGTGLSRVYCIQESRPHIVSATLPDGTVYRFRPADTAECLPLVPDSLVLMAWAPVRVSPVAALGIVGGSTADLTQVVGPTELFDLSTGLTVDPDLYLLTLPDGRSLRVRQDVGLERMTDLNGNTLTISSNGVWALQRQARGLRA
jgi:hypothetical protein